MVINIMMWQKKVIELLNYLVLKYNIDFTLVLPNEEIKEIYINA